MGLDISHGTWHGAYSAFSRWRNAVWVAGGEKLVEVKDGPFGMSREVPDGIDWDSITEANLNGHWKETQDPLVILMAHYDTDGEIYDTEALADRLEEVLPNLTEVEEAGHIGSYREKTKTFIAGLRRAADAGEPVIFH